MALFAEQKRQKGRRIEDGHLRRLSLRRSAISASTTRFGLSSHRGGRPTPAARTAIPLQNRSPRRRTTARKVVDLADPRLCVATIHPHNTFARDVTGAFWHPRPFDDIRRVMDDDEKAHQPLVSCIMPTFNRRRFVPMALRWFAAQDWPTAS